MRRKAGKQRSDDELLRDLVLLKNDANLLDEFYERAIQGSIDAQYGLALIYAEGRGTEEDLVRAFAWLTVCGIQGDEDAQTLRMVVSERMTEDEFQQSLDLSLQIKQALDNYQRHGHLTVIK